MLLSTVDVFQIVREVCDDQVLTVAGLYLILSIEIRFTVSKGTLYIHQRHPEGVKFEL